MTKTFERDKKCARKIMSELNGDRKGGNSIDSAPDDVDGDVHSLERLKGRDIALVLEAETIRDIANGERKSPVSVFVQIGFVHGPQVDGRKEARSRDGSNLPFKNPIVAQER